MTYFFKILTVATLLATIVVSAATSLGVAMSPIVTVHAAVIEQALSDLQR